MEHLRQGKIDKAKLLDDDVLLCEYYQLARKGFMEQTKSEQQSAAIIRAEIITRMGN